MIFEKYKRQIEVFGIDGQERLQNARVLVIGAGGLGSPVIAYLAAAGVGRLGIVDGDTVELSNLQRQIIHAGNLNENKAESAAMFVEKLNPDVVVDVYPYWIHPRNALRLIKSYDVIVGCPDSFKIRYIINDASMLLKKPFVHSAVYGWEGELSVFTGNPCYRCYLPESPETGGTAIVGATAGVFGAMQASEVIKLITRNGSLTSGRVLRGDLSTMEFFSFTIPANNNCPVCSGKLNGMFEENYTGRCEIKRFV
ncbi:HesA/MoeB/ThiF family protein [Archaeoglobus neptunius]|uniref:HesA/MoeB/ThiF family protein n=1 Tax=Archaeoglobus neptunius TaxID=2798580 RepID=UPI001E456382|nr:HesA/MoeB/ThiF family protein [Archaeoglobus neptunius]